MKLIETLAELLRQHGRQELQPDLWEDHAWKNLYYGYFNKVWDVLHEIDKLNLSKLEALKSPLVD